MKNFLSNVFISLRNFYADATMARIFS